MYTITFGDHLVYDPEQEDYLIYNPDAHLAIGEPGRLSFSLPPAHPSYQYLTKMRGVLELAEDGVVVYRGRITKDTKNFDNCHNLETEGMMAVLNDSAIPPFDFPADVASDPAYQAAAASGNVVAYFLGWILSQHNAQVTTEQQIQLGTVTVADSNNYIARASSDYGSAWQVITDKLVNSTLGGYLLIRYEANGNYLDYYSSLPLTNTQRVTFGENLLDLVNDLDASEIYSAILPIGKDRLTIAALPDGAVTADITKAGALLYSASRRAAFGNITKVEKWDDVTVASNLQSKAAAMLAQSGMRQNIRVKAADLHYADSTVAPFRVGRLIQLSSTPHGLSATYPLTELEPDLLDPGNTSITLGAETITKTGFDKYARQEIDARADKQQIQLDTVSADIDDLPTAVTTQITQAIQSSQAIIFQALEEYVQTGDLNSYKQQVAAQFTLTAQQIEMSFRTATDQISAVNGDLQEKYNERLKYIRFVDGDILLGEQGNEITLTIQNDRLSFQQNGVEVAYFSNNKLYVTSAVFSVSAGIGDFAFIPGENGNLSFRKVV